MTEEISKKASIKEKAIHETQQFLAIFTYLAIFLCCLAAYGMVVAQKFNASYFTFGAAIVNALIIAKVILIGEYAHLGKKQESRALAVSAVYKAFVFTLLVFAFHFVEEVIKLLFKGESLSAALREIRLDEVLVRSAVIFCTFIPLFAFRELQRVLGQQRFRALFFQKSSDPSAAAAD
jgi:hypothetical protein